MHDRDGGGLRTPRSQAALAAAVAGRSSRDAAELGDRAAFDVLMRRRSRSAPSLGEARIAVDLGRELEDPMMLARGLRDEAAAALLELERHYARHGTKERQDT
jgi:hypothetical protein